jgi:uncharacterized membrane protein
VAHTHSRPVRPAGGQLAMVDAAELRRHRRALRMLVVVLIPLAVWTLVGLIALWPGDISESVNSDVAGYSIPGVTYPTARVTAVEEISCQGLSGSTPGVDDSRCANVTAQLLEGDDEGLSATVPLTDALYSSGVEVGQKVKLIRIPPADGQPSQFQFSDFERRTPLVLLSVVFAAVVVAIARWRGFASLVGLGFAGFILVKFMFPALVAGQNPILIGLIGSAAIMFVVLYAAHGFSARTTTALVGTLFGLILIALLGWGATRWAHLTGVAAEDDYVLAAAAPNLSLTSVVMCGIILAGLGVLNDVTITQASAVWELADGQDPDGEGRTQRRLFSRAMRIGRDHIASTIYTIAFATAGASLSVLLLIAVYDRPLLQVLQTEQFAGELIRTLVGSIGLVLAVPLTTAIGVAVVRASDRGSALDATQGSGAADELEDLEPAPAADPAQRPDDEAEDRADVDAATTPAAPAPAADRAAGAAEPAGPAGRTPEGPSTSEAETEAKWRRWRRHKPVDDFGFSDLRDPDEKGTGSGGRPGR